MKIEITLTGTGISIKSTPISSKREHKGKNILKTPDDFVVIDIETTGFDPHFDSIIEFAAIRYDNLKVTDEFSMLVNPGFEIDDFITDLTGITNDMLSHAPPIADILPDFLEFIGNDIILGHNVNFDINFLYDNAIDNNFPPLSNNFIDTMRLSRKLFPEEKHHRLCDLVSRFGIEHSNAHRALSDCRATASCYLYMLDHIQEHSIDITSLACSRNTIKATRKATRITATTDHFDINNPLYGKSCVFTGTLQRMSRKDAMQAVINIGGMCEDRITKKTNYLILGNNDYCKSIKDGKSNKQKQAEKYKLAGNDIEIISEDVFYEMIAMML